MKRGGAIAPHPEDYFVFGSKVGAVIPGHASA
jgi:hypothetical protein